MNLLYTLNAASVTYPSYTRGALAIGKPLLAGAADVSYSWIDGQMKNALATESYYVMDRKWMIAPRP